MPTRNIAVEEPIPEKSQQHWHCIITTTLVESNGSQPEETQPQGLGLHHKVCLPRLLRTLSFFLSCTHHATCGEPLASLEGCWKTHAWGSVGGWICWDSIECLTMLEFWHTHLHTRQNRKVTHQTHSHQLKRSLKRLFLEKEHFLSAFNHCMTARLWIISVKSEVPLNPTEYKQNKSTTPCRWMGSRQLPNYADSNTTLVEFESWDIRLMFSLSWWCNRHTSDCEDQSDLQKSLLMKKTTD